eukprot:COSAG01_NODE_29871_length_627_cov_61.498106_1_plen_98_part_00
MYGNLSHCCGSDHEISDRLGAHLLLHQLLLRLDDLPGRPVRLSRYFVTRTDATQVNLSQNRPRYAAKDATAAAQLALARHLGVIFREVCPTQTLSRE